ncbi:MAG: hypothetical protein HQK87_00855 [Nitrospinae bacterium]|nr:hypothetical protein [Nitrospinota bacterium]
MNSTLYVHIGAPKTGSTALQLFFDRNREALRHRFALYPRATARAGGHHDIAFLTGGGYPEWATPQETSLEDLLGELDRELADHTGDALISSENFYLFPNPKSLEDRLLSLPSLKGRRVQVIVYLRPQEEVVEAWYNQTVKAQGSTATFAESLERDRDLWDYEARLKPWADIFGRENIRARLYGGGSDSTWDICADFVAWFGISPLGLVFPEVRSNTNLNRDLLEFQRMVNRLPMTPIQKRSLQKQLADLSLRTRGSGLFCESSFLSQENRRALRAEYERSNRNVAKDYLDGEELFSPLYDDAVPHAPYGGLSVETLASLVGWLLIESPQK